MKMENSTDTEVHQVLDESDLEDVPTSKDWKKHGYVASVKNQGYTHMCEYHDTDMCI